MRKKLLIVITAIALCLASAFAFAACEPKAPTKGFDIDAAKAAGEYWGLEVRFQKITWESKEFELNSGNIDLIWNGLTISDERKETMQISLPYMKNRQVAVVRKAELSKFDSKEKLAAGNIVAENGSAGADVAAQQFSGSSFTSLVDQITALTEVAAGNSDIAIIDSVMANYYTTSAESSFKDKLVVVPDLVFVTEQYGIAAKKDELGTISKTNEALAALSQNGKLAEIARVYGLDADVIDVEYTSDFDGLTDADKAGWNKIVERGYIVIGYTLYAPIAYN